jgi:hypothetical protein
MEGEGEDGKRKKKSEEKMKEVKIGKKRSWSLTNQKGSDTTIVRQIL